jgi:hypothetical protein
LRSAAASRAPASHRRRASHRRLARAAQVIIQCVDGEDAGRGSCNRSGHGALLDWAVDMAATDGDEHTTHAQLPAEIEARRGEPGAGATRRRWIAPEVRCVPITAAMPSASASAPAVNPAREQADAEPRYVPYLTSRFWEETGLDRTRYGTFVETGSYRGFTLDFMKDHFRCLHSIELSRKWYDYCVERFKDHPHVHLYHGDSARLLPRILGGVEEPVIVFLDAHYSGGSTAKPESGCDSPLLAELTYLRSRTPDDIIIIDDAGFFDRKGGEEPASVDDDQVWPPFAYDWTGIRREGVLSLMKPGYRFVENTRSRYTLTPREDQIILYPPAA